MARSLFDQSAADMAKNKSLGAASLLLRAEAAALLGRLDARMPADKETHDPK